MRKLTSSGVPVAGRRPPALATRDTVRRGVQLAAGHLLRTCRGHNFTVFGAIPLAPALAMLYLVCGSWVAAPHMDQWDYEGATLSRHYQNRLTPADLFAQHNESRLVLARLVTLLVAPPTGWDIRYDSFLTIIAAALLVVGFNILILRTTVLTRSQQVFCAVAADVSLLASTQWEVFLFGAYYFLVPGVALVWCLIVARSDWTPAVKVITWSSLSLLATLAYVNGVLIWLLLLPSTLTCKHYRRRDRIAAVMFYVTGVGVLVAYFATFTRPAHHPDYHTTLVDTLALLTYYTVWVGAPLGHVAHSITVSVAVGSTLLIMAIGLSVYLACRYWRSACREASDWIVLSCFVLVTGAAISIGRTGLGVEQALASRYHSFSLLLLPTVLILLMITVNAAFQKTESIRNGTVFLAGVGACLFALSYFQGWLDAKSYASLRQRAQLAIQFIDIIPDNPQLSLAHPAPHVLIRISSDLQALRLPHIRVGAQELAAVVQRTGPGDGTNGFVDRVVDLGDGRLSIAGWAILKDRSSPADCVLVVWQDTNGLVKPISVLPVNVERPDVATVLRNPSLLNSGFNSEVSKANIPRSGTIAVWSVDMKALHAFQLGGTNRIM